ncbi:MAG: hypothetical protein LBL66_07540, partial [Clostridiales bacterium]|nr:hypothetical protein [Clostridiales bacterium]
RGKENIKIYNEYADDIKYIDHNFKFDNSPPEISDAALIAAVAAPAVAIGLALAFLPEIMKLFKRRRG